MSARMRAARALWSLADWILFAPDRARRAAAGAHDALHRQVRRAGGRVAGCSCLDSDPEGCAAMSSGDGFGYCECPHHGAP